MDGEVGVSDIFLNFVRLEKSQIIKNMTIINISAKIRNIFFDVFIKYNVASNFVLILDK